MKNIAPFYALIFFIFLFSCSSNEDEFSHDPIIGDWILYKHTKDNIEEPLSDCDKQRHIRYFRNGIYYEFIVKYDFNGECITIETRRGRWKNTGNGYYNLKLNNSSVSSNTKYIFEVSRHYVEYTINNKINKVYYKRSYL